MSFEAINPANGKTIATYPGTPKENFDQLLNAAVEAQTAWAREPFAKRAQVLRRAAELLRQQAVDLAKLMAGEMGKPVAQGRSEVEKCAWVCDYYAEHGEDFLADESIESDAQNSYVAYRPLGLVLAVMPWNFPFWQVFRFAAPALMAGNGGLLKHASNVPGCALAIERIWQDAGLPEHVFTSLLISSEDVEELIADARVKAVTLTGSTPAGRAVASLAGEHLKKSVLELGGSDAYVILEDADLERAADLCVESRMINSGQSCIAAKRFIVVEPIRRRFEELVLERILQVRMADPFDDEADIGPMARHDLRDELHEQVQKSLEAGARKQTGGLVPEGPGAYYPPTLLTEVKPGMPAYDQELFGPVAAILPAADEDDAVRIANDSVFGLGAAVFTGDLQRGERLAADRLDAGCCFVNDFVRSDPRLPFGGIKESGYGRELSRHGIREFVNIKTVYIK